MLIISLKSGQLGNRLEFFARIIAYAKENSTTVINPAFHEYAPFFEHTSQSLLCKYPPEKSPATYAWLRKLIYLGHLCAARTIDALKANNRWFGSMSLAWGEKANLTEKKPPNSLFVWLHGWKFRVGNLADKHQDEIRTYFALKKCYANNVENHFAFISQGYDLVIGIHIRQGDYEHFQEGKFYYSSEEYNLFIQQILSLFAHKSVRFLICSNVVQSKETFKSASVSFGTGHIVEDLYLLSCCDYLFGPPSTYTKWASFYGKVPLCMIEDKSQRLRLDCCKVARL